jgi:hypothetical protein
VRWSCWGPSCRRETPVPAPRGVLIVLATSCCCWPRRHYRLMRRPASRSGAPAGLLQPPACRRPGPGAGGVLYTLVPPGGAEPGKVGRDHRGCPVRRPAVLGRRSSH